MSGQVAEDGTRVAVHIPTSPVLRDNPRSNSDVSAASTVSEEIQLLFTSWYFLIH